MARMKFICDAERCIECNGCVTACKARARHPVGREPPPRRHPQRRRPRRAQHLGRVHALLGRAVHGGLPGRLLLPHARRRRPARQGHLHRLRLLLVRVPVRRAPVPDQRDLRPARQDGQMHVLRRRPRRERQPGRVREVRPQPPCRGQAPGVRRDVLDEGAPRRRRRRRRRHLPHPRPQPRQGQRGLGLGHRVRQADAGHARHRAAPAKKS